MVASSPRTFNVDKPLFKNHYSVYSEETQSRLYAQIRIASKPCLTLHDGSDTSAPILAVAHLIKINSNFKIGLGDPANDRSVMWEDLIRANIQASKYRWSVELPDAPEPVGTEGRARLVWKKTRKIAVDGGQIRTWSLRNWVLVNEADENSDCIFAVFTGSLAKGKCGVLQINANFGRDFDTMVFITLLSVYERDRRM